MRRGIATLDGGDGLVVGRRHADSVGRNYEGLRGRRRAYWLRDEDLAVAVVGEVTADPAGVAYGRPRRKTCSSVTSFCSQARQVLPSVSVPHPGVEQRRITTEPLPAARAVPAGRVFREQVPRAAQLRSPDAWRARRAGTRPVPSSDTRSRRGAAPAGRLRPCSGRRSRQCNRTVGDRRRDRPWFPAR